MLLVYMVSGMNFWHKKNKIRALFSGEDHLDSMAFGY